MARQQPIVPCATHAGAVAAFNAAWYRPDAFGRVVSHCGSFTNIKGAHNYPWIIRNTAPRKPIIKVFLQTGEHDLDNVHGSWPLANREMAAALTFAGYENHFVFGEGSHSWKHGGAIFPETMRWLWNDDDGASDDTRASATREGPHPPEIEALHVAKI